MGILLAIVSTGCAESSFTVETKLTQNGAIADVKDNSIGWNNTYNGTNEEDAIYIAVDAWFKYNESRKAKYR